jgi:signal transduction histidine kinase
VTDPTAPVRPLVGPGRWHRMAPFLVVGAIGLPLAMATPSYSAPALMLAGAVLVAIVGAVAVLPWSRWPVGWQAAPAMAFYAVAALLQYAAGQYAQFIIMTALPVIWLALLHTRRLLVLGLVLLAAALFVPRLLWPDGYQELSWETAAMVFVLTCLGCLAGQHMTVQTRIAAAATVEALHRERQAADRLRELDRIKDDFVAMVSHDLRTPLTSIVGNTELLLDGAAGEVGPMQRRLLEAVDRNAHRLESLVDDLLLLSRIESGSLRPQRRTVSMNEVVAGALEALAAQRAADVQVAVDVPDEPVLVCGDPDQLERVTTNLVSNALKFTPPGGRVAIRVRNGSGRAWLTVSDTGIGIPTDELPYVFDRFYRSSRSGRRGIKGTGLGLAIAKSIVDQHRGTISASGNAAGGTTFVVSLPRIAADADVSEPEHV